MSWSIRRENVRLRVTKFTPDQAPPAPPPIRSAIEAHKERRKREQKKVAPAVGLPR